MGFLAPERLARIVSGCMAQPSMHESLNHTMDTMSHSTIINPSTVFTTESGPFQQIQATALENDAGSHLEDEDTAASFNIFSNSITRNPSVVPANNIKHHAPSGT